MLPLFFGPPSRRLFGAFHEGSSGRLDALAVVLCNPFGQEAIRTQRLYRVLAVRLAQAGIHVLRFDYFGTGDSAGDEGEADMTGWRQDIWSAHHELARLSGATGFAWMGARLGAALAIQAAGQAEGRTGSAPRLIAWDPVVDGAGYAQMLRNRHVDTLERSYSLPDPAWRQRLREDVTSFQDEAIGIAIPAALRAQLRQLEGASLALPRNSETVVISDPLDESVNTWIRNERHHGAAVQVVEMAQALEWTSDDSLNAALVPAEAVQQLVLAIDR